MKRIYSICAFLFLLGSVSVYAVLGVRLAFCAVVFTDASELSRMAVEALGDFVFFCLCARILLLLVRQSKISKAYVWWFFLAVTWIGVIQFCASQLRAFLEMWFCLGNPKCWLLFIHFFILSPVFVAFVFSVKDVAKRKKVDPNRGG